MDNFTPFERHRLDRSHYGTICSRCGYLRCELCGVVCQCPAELRLFVSWLQSAINNALSEEPMLGAGSRARINAGRTSITVVVNGPKRGQRQQFVVRVDAE